MEFEIKSKTKIEALKRFLTLFHLKIRWKNEELEARIFFCYREKCPSTLYAHQGGKELMRDYGNKFYIKKLLKPLPDTNENLMGS